MMSAWIISIVGVICLGVLLEIVLPEGKTSKYVKGTFSLLVIFVIILPLPKLLNGEIDLGKYEEIFKVDDSVQTTYFEKYTAGVEEQLKIELRTSGYETSVKVNVKEGKLQSVYIEVFNFSKRVEDTVSKDIKAIIAGKLKCGEDVIKVSLIE